MLHRHAARLRGFARQRHIDQAAKMLRAAAGAEPRLSQDARLDVAQSRMMEAIVGLRRAPMRGWRPGGTRQAGRCPE